MNITETKIYKFFEDEKSIDKLAKDIKDLFVEKAAKSNMEYSFDISKETGQVKIRKANTSFVCDILPETTLFSFKKMLFDIDLKEMTEKEDEQLVEDTKNFLIKVGDKTIEKYFKEIRNKIREVVLSDSDDRVIPLSEIIINKLDIMDYSSVPEPSRYTINIGKIPGKDIGVPEIIGYVYNQQEETNKTVKQIFEEEKIELHNPLFDNVIGLEQGSKYLHEVSISFFVDYSIKKN